MVFPRKFTDKKYTVKLDRIAEKEKHLVEKWILNSVKNPYYRQEYKQRNEKIQVGDVEYYALIDWLLPSVRYNYREVDWNTFCKNDEYKLVRASVIPVVEIRGENHWLFGSFHDYRDTDNHILTDFAGSCEKKDLLNNASDCPALNCILRELNEEGKGLLNDVVKTAIENKNISIFEGKNEERKEKLFFLFVALSYESVKNIPYLFGEIYQKGERLGPLTFRKQKDVKNLKFRTAKNLTDFLFYLRNI